MASIFGKRHINAEGKEAGYIIGTLFDPKVIGSGAGEKVVGNLSVSAGKGQDGSYRYETWSLSLKADDAAKALQSKDKLKLTSWGLSSYYDKEKKETKVYLNGFEWEKHVPQNGGNGGNGGNTPASASVQTAPAPAPAPAEDVNPFDSNPFAGAPDFNVG